MSQERESPLSAIRHEDGLALCCSHCGSEYTHHYAVDVYFRNEDKNSGVHSFTTRAGTRADSHMTDNPSRRRSGIRVRCSCEQCDGITEIIVEQHKGETLLSTRAMPRTE